MICRVLHELCKCSEDCKNARHYYTAEAETEEDFEERKIKKLTYEMAYKVRLITPTGFSTVIFWYLPYYFSMLYS